MHVGFPRSLNSRIKLEADVACVLHVQVRCDQEASNAILSVVQRQVLTPVRRTLCDLISRYRPDLLALVKAPVTSAPGPGWPVPDTATEAIHDSRELPVADVSTVVAYWTPAQFAERGEERGFLAITAHQQVHGLLVLPTPGVRCEFDIAAGWPLAHPYLSTSFDLEVIGAIIRLHAVSWWLARICLDRSLEEWHEAHSGDLREDVAGLAAYGLASDLLVAHLAESAVLNAGVAGGVRWPLIPLAGGRFDDPGLPPTPSAPRLLAAAVPGKRCTPVRSLLGSAVMPDPGKSNTPTGRWCRPPAKAWTRRDQTGLLPMWSPR